MNVRLVSFSAGLVMATAAVFILSERMNTPSDQPRQARSGAAELPFRVTRVLVAATDLKFGNRIGREHLKVASWPAESVPEGAFSTPDQLLGDGEEDRVVLKAMAPGEPVLKSKVSGFGARATMSTRIEKDKRAFAIRINAVSGVSGFLLPGDRVDVLLTRKVGSNRNNQVTDVVLQNVMVRGIDQISDEDRNKPQVARTVTVEVTSEQAQKLALAMQVGTLSLALRNALSAEVSPSRTISVGDLQGRRKARRPAAPSVRVRRGSDVSVVRVRGN